MSKVFYISYDVREGDDYKPLTDELKRRKAKHVL